MNDNFNHLNNSECLVKSILTGHTLVIIIDINTTENHNFMTGKLCADNFDFLYNMNQETCPIFSFVPDGSNAHKNSRLISKPLSQNAVFTYLSQVLKIWPKISCLPQVCSQAVKTVLS